MLSNVGVRSRSGARPCIDDLEGSCPLVSAFARITVTTGVAADAQVCVSGSGTMFRGNYSSTVCDPIACFNKFESLDCHTHNITGASVGIINTLNW